MRLHDKRLAAMRRLPEDYEPYGSTSREGGDCSCGCRFYDVIDSDWGVCLNPDSARYGLLTFEHQGCAKYEDGSLLVDTYKTTHAALLELKKHPVKNNWAIFSHERELRELQESMCEEELQEIAELSPRGETVVSQEELLLLDQEQLQIRKRLIPCDCARPLPGVWIDENEQQHPRCRLCNRRFIVTEVPSST